MIERNQDCRFDIKLPEGEQAEERLIRVLSAKGPLVEVKSEPKYAQTGNVAVEFEQSDGAGGTKPSGIHELATESQWWVIEYAVDRFLILPTQALREIARREYRASGPIRMGDNGNIGVLVPLASLIDPWMVSPHEEHGKPNLAEAA